MSRRWSRRAPVLLGGFGLLLVASVAALAAADPRAASPSSTREALSAYQQRVVPVVKDWGSIEVLGMCCPPLHRSARP